MAYLFCPNLRATETLWFMQTSSVRFLADMETFSEKKKYKNTSLQTKLRVTAISAKSHYSSPPSIDSFAPSTLLPQYMQSLVSQLNILLCGLA